MTLRIDSHHHLWRYNPLDYGWIDDSMSTLRRDFLPSELQCEAVSAGVNATILVQARQTIEETDELLHIADTTPIVGGVVGWLPLASPTFPQHLERLRGARALKGLRHVLQAERPSFLADPDFNRGLQAMQDTGLVYDLLLRKEQVEEAIAMVDRYPNQIFVLDHMAKPAVGREDLLPAWATPMARLAKRPNVFCKLSGLVTEAEQYRWSPATLAPYLDAALSCFGADRLMAGTDWPVLTVACTYAEWWQTVEAWASPLTLSERNAILGSTANTVYNLQREDPGNSHESSVADQTRTR